jgi:hypothetical protein
VTPAEDVAALTAEVADLRALVAELADKAPVIAEAIWQLDAFNEVVRASRRAGYVQGRAEWDDRQADANARQARAKFTVLPGGRAVPKGRKAAASRLRKSPGGAA